MRQNGLAWEVHGVGEGHRVWRRLCRRGLGGEAKAEAMHQPEAQTRDQEQPNAKAEELPSAHLLSCTETSCRTVGFEYTLPVIHRLMTRALTM